MLMHAFMHIVSPMLQELQQEVIASVGHDVLGAPRDKKNGQCRAGGWEGRTLVGRGSWHSRGGDDLILGSSDQQHRTLEPSEDSEIRRQSSEGKRTTGHHP